MNTFRTVAICLVIVVLTAWGYNAIRRNLNAPAAPPARQERVEPAAEPPLPAADRTQPSDMRTGWRLVEKFIPGPEHS